MQTKLITKEEQPIKRRRWLHVATSGLLGAIAGSWATRRWLNGDRARPTRLVHDQDLAAAPVTITTPQGIRIHGIQTGLLAIKSAHADLQGIKALRLLSILQDRDWSGLLPILTWVIEHPEGLFVIDTGERAIASDIDRYMANDPANRWFFKHNLPMFVTPAEELATQMHGLGLDPALVKTVILTHLHEDHTGGLASFPNANFLVARTEYEGQLRQPMGAVQSVWPTNFKPQLIEYSGPAIAQFPCSETLTRAGDLLIVPTPGHSYGHQSILLISPEKTYFFAGDLAFNDTQLKQRGLQGIAFNLDLAHESIEHTLQYAHNTPTIFLPSHDPHSLMRLQKSNLLVC